MSDPIVFVIHFSTGQWSRSLLWWWSSMVYRMSPRRQTRSDTGMKWD